MQDMLKPAVKGWRRVIRMDRRAAAPRLYVPVQPTLDAHLCMTV